MADAHATPHLAISTAPSTFPRPYPTQLQTAFLFVGSTSAMTQPPPVVRACLRLHSVVIGLFESSGIVGRAEPTRRFSPAPPSGISPQWSEHLQRPDPAKTASSTPF